jgi:hypothetical protein
LFRGSSDYFSSFMADIEGSLENVRTPKARLDGDSSLRLIRSTHPAPL